MEINNHKPYSRCRVWRCDVTTSNSIQDGGALVVNILVFDLREQLQHCTYQRKTLLFASIKVITFICKREISDLSSPLTSEVGGSRSDDWTTEALWLYRMVWLIKIIFCFSADACKVVSRAARTFSRLYEWTGRNIYIDKIRTLYECIRGSITRGIPRETCVGMVDQVSDEQYVQNENY